MRIFQIEHLKDGIVGVLVLTLDNRIVHAAFLNCHVVLKHRLAMQPNPGVAGAGDGHLHIGISLHILVYILGVVGAEPELAVLLEAEHKGTALGFSVTANGGEILNGVFLQKLGDFFHDNYLQSVFCLGKVAFSFRWYYNNAVELIRKVSTILCRSYQKETIGV